VRVSDGEASFIELPGVPLGSFVGSEYDEISYPLHSAICLSSLGRRVRSHERAAAEFTPTVSSRSSSNTATARQSNRQRIVTGSEHRAGFPAEDDDMTVVAVKIGELPAPKADGFQPLTAESKSEGSQRLEVRTSVGGPPIRKENARGTERWRVKARQAGCMGSPPIKIVALHRPGARDAACQRLPVMLRTPLMPSDSIALNIKTRAVRRKFAKTH
jgi:hypothetical protein